MAVEVNKAYLLGEFSVEPDKRRLRRGSQELHLASRPFHVLLYLIEHCDRLVTRGELLERFWEGKDVYDETLTKCVGAIRKALDDRQDSPRFIETRYAEGYRFIGPLEEQLVRGEAAIMEIVKTRGVKIVVEEEIHDDAVTVNHPTVPSSVVAETNAAGTIQTLARPQARSAAQSSTLNSTRSQLFRSVAIVGLVAVALAAAMTILRGRNSATVPAVEPSLTSRSIAVLPLKNLTGDANDEYLSDGLTDSLINELARIKSLKVISRASSFTFKGQETDAREVGRRLGVANILEGSIHRSGDRIRINLRLVSTTDGRVVWTGDNFDRALTDIFTLQDEISCSVAENLRVILCGEQSHKRYTENVAAYQAYLKGRYHWNKRTPEGIRKSIEFYEQALALDANYALAYAGLAESYVQGVWHVPFAPEEAVPKAKVAGLQAAALDDSLAEAHTALAGVYSMEWNWAATGRELQRAIELNPQYARAYHVQAFHFLVTGRYDEAVASIKRACELDPLNLVVNTDAGNILLGARRTDEAFRQWQKALELDPNFVMAHQQQYEAYIVKGDEPAAVAEYLKTLGLTGQSPKKIAGYRQAAARGLTGIWQKELSDLQVQRARGGYVPPISLALLYTRLGQNDEALAQLEQVYRTRSAAIVLTVSPMFDPLRSDPRFQAIMRRAGLLG